MELKKCTEKVAKNAPEFKRLHSECHYKRTPGFFYFCSFTLQLPFGPSNPPFFTLLANKVFTHPLST